MKRSTTNIEALTEFQKIFIDCYVVNFNGTRAFIQASEMANREPVKYVSAQSEAYKLLKKPSVQREIDRILEDRMEANKHEFEQVIADLKVQAFYDIGDYVTVRKGCTVTVKDLKDIPEQLHPAIKCIKPTKFGLSVEFVDRTKAQELLSKLLGFYEDRVRINNGDGVTIKVDIPKANNDKSD